MREAAARTPVNPTTRQHVEQRHFLGQSERMVERGQGHRRTDAQAFRARGGQRAQHVYRGADAEGGEMMLGEPYRIEAAAIHDLDALERARIDLFQRPVPAGPAEELQHAYLHRHSALMPASLTIGHHFSISAFWKAPSACGVSWSGGGMSWPRAASFSFVPGSPSDFTTAPFSLAMISAGVPLCAHRPCHTET